MSKFWYVTIKKPIYLFCILFTFAPLAGKGLPPFTENPADMPFPEIVQKDGKYTLYVDGKPYLILGAQLWNSSAWPSILPGIWPQMKELHCNTVEAPVYWEAIEPEPGQFNFAEVDSLVYGARRHGLRLVLLWFGSFKNGSMSYAPTWVETQPEKYPRMHDTSGQPIQVLSVLSEENLKADQRAFVQLMRHLKEIDAEHKTVIMVQVENEPGSLGTNRDYSPKANELFNQQVPASLTQALQKNAGTWEEVFGVDAAEAFNAFHIATFINKIAAAGKAVYPLPMYANVWIRENYFQWPGEYPSGGPTSNMMDVWKAAARELFTLALDIYHQNVEDFRDLCEKYNRTDNPLFIPEMGNGVHFARYQFYALADYNAIGIAPYGIDPFHVSPHDKRDKTQLDAKFDEIAANYDIFQKAMPAIIDLQGTGHLKAVGEEEGLKERLVSFDHYDMMVQFGFPTYQEPDTRSGRIMIGQLSDDEFILIGFDTKFTFRPKYGSAYNKAEYVSIEEGYYENDKWHRTRIWNGDAAYHATLPPQGAVLKVKLQRMASSQELQQKPNFEQ